MDHILTKSKDSVTQHGVITSGDYEFIFCNKCLQPGEHNTISVRTYKNYSKLEEWLTKIKLSNYLLFPCADSA